MEKELTRRQQQAQKTKQRIFFSAIALFEKNNYEDVSIANITEAVGCSVGNFYHYFKSKEELIMYGYVMMDQLIEEKIRAVEVKSNVDGIRTLILFQAFCINRATAMVTSQALRIQLVTGGEYYLNEDRWYHKHLKSLGRAAIEEGEFRQDCDEEETANAILRQAIGVLTDWAMRGGSYNLKEAAVRDLNLLLSNFMA